MSRIPHSFKTHYSYIIQHKQFLHSISQVRQQLFIKLTNKMETCKVMDSILAYKFQVKLSKSFTMLHAINYELNPHFLIQSNPHFHQIKAYTLHNTLAIKWYLWLHLSVKFLAGNVNWSNWIYINTNKHSTKVTGITSQRTKHWKENWKLTKSEKKHEPT